MVLLDKNRLELTDDTDAGILEGFIENLRDAGINESYLKKLEETTTFKEGIGKEAEYQYFIVSETLRGLLYWYINAVGAEEASKRFLIRYIMLIEVSEFSDFIWIMKHEKIVDKINEEDSRDE